LGIQGNQPKDQRKPQKDEKKRGRKSLKQAHTRDRSLHGELQLDPPHLRQLSPSPLPLLLMKILSWNIRGLNGCSKKKLL
jgi:hypothetical protein